MKCKNTGSFSAICLIVSAVMIIVWGASMACTTWLQAETYYRLLCRTQPKSWEEHIDRSISGIAEMYEAGQDAVGKDGFWAKKMPAAYMTLFSNYTDYFLLGHVRMHSATGMLVRSSKDETVMHNRDILLCYYLSEQTWNKGSGPQDGNAWVDLEKDPALKAALVQLANQEGFLPFDYLRITGCFEGDELIPRRVEYGAYVGSGFRGVKEFVTVYEAKTWAENETVTVYAEHNEISSFEENAPVHYRGVRFQNPVELLKAVGKAEDRESLVELIEFKSMTLQAPDEHGKEETYTVLLAIVHYPLLAAAEQLVWVYIWTFVLGAALVGVILWVIHRKLIQPLHVLDAGFWSVVRTWPSWAEPEKLARQMEEMDKKIKERNDSLRKKENELFRLDQAREFAVKNEEKRARMVSGMAHELKTPLAIISGYAQGLQEQIAEEKRERYLENILSETKHMDGLVMQMLELSRLEAGKVTLARDEFDLSAMIRAVFDKFALAAEQRRLQIELDLEGEKPVYADESRMEQIIRNLVSNAVRYVSEGGCIRVALQHLAGFAEVRIYNDAAAFTDEEIARIWDAFYRTDSARRGKGTGLGLAITKNLVQLHGGSCNVKNVSGGVEFSFRIPQQYE